MVVAYLPRWKQGTVLEGNSLFQRIELRTRLVVFLGHPVKVAAFLARVAEKTRLLSSVKTKGLVAIHQVVNLVDALSLKHLLNYQPEVIGWRNFRLNLLPPPLNLLDFFLCEGDLSFGLNLGLVLREWLFLYLLYGFNDCGYVLLEFDQLYLPLRSIHHKCLI